MREHLSETFLKNYPDFPSHMTPLGQFVYYRTYSRWLPEKGRRETWKETVTRAVEYNASLLDTTQKEAEQLFDNMFNLRQFLSGRTLWVGGTQVAEDYPMANFNCAFLTIDSFGAFKELFYALMIGTGAGLRVLKEDIEQLPPVRQDVKLSHREYTPLPKEFREDNTSVIYEGDKAAIYVGDSKEGWTQALDIYFNTIADHAYRKVKEIEIVYDNVRPKGERLRRFGGTASGHESLKTMFEKIENVVNTDKYADKPVDGQLRPIHALDIANIIGENVVVGGVRRTAEIALGSSDDEEFLLAKKDLTPDKFHRFMSNNSVYYQEKPTREQIAKQFEILKNEGEPAFVNAEAASERREDFAGVNPCVEILLADRGLCNLTTTNVTQFVENGQLDLDGLIEAHKVTARAAYRMTNVDLELPNWDRQQKKDRLTGVSVTGWQDAMSEIGADREFETMLLEMLKGAARGAADAYADETGLNRPILSTAVKPEGTLSTVAGGVSSGLHHAHSPYYIRRVRINADDPLCKAVERLGWSVKNEVGQGMTLDDGTYVPVKTKVIEFPVYSPVSRTKYDVSAKEQLQTYFDFQNHYTEHNSSNTVTVKDDEWDEVEQIIADRWDEVVAVSFLKLDNHVYDKAPYEAIDEETFENMRDNMESFDPSLLVEDDGEDFDLEGAESCSGGICPIR